jgi:hypothetical protein
MFNSKSPLPNFITTPKSNIAFNFLDSANTTPAPLQPNMADLNTPPPSTNTNATNFIMDTQLSNLASEVSSSTASACPLGLSSPAKRKYQVKQRSVGQLSGIQHKHHCGPVDNTTRKEGAALAQTKMGRTETLFNKATQLHKVTGLDVSILIRDQDTISTHFTNTNTANRIGPQMKNLFDCELVVKQKEHGQMCTLLGNNKKLKLLENTGQKADISLDPEYEAMLNKKSFISRWATKTIESSDKGKTNFAYF